MDKQPVVDIIVPGSPGALRRLVRAALAFGTGLAALGAVAGAALIWHFNATLPAFNSLSEYRPPLTTRFFAADGRLVGEFAVERRDLVPYHMIPKRLVQAFVAGEDDRFFEHYGIDPLGIFRAAVKNLKAGRIVQGGSTITQQVAKSFLSREKTFKRKAREAILAFKLEAKFHKEDIIWLYLNQIYLGHGAYGVGAAARVYFDKNVWDLNLAEMATLAGLPQAPSTYSPYSNPKEAARRQHYVLQRMVDEGYISEAERQDALKQKLNIRDVRDFFKEEAPYYTEHVRRYIQQVYGDDALYRGGLQVHLAVDLRRQWDAEFALQNGVRKVDRRQGYLGPMGNIPQGDWADFRKRYAAAKLKGKIPGADEVYVGLVTGFEGKDARVAVGPHEGRIPVGTMDWAREAVVGMEWKKINDARQALKAGDLILVRPVEDEKAAKKKGKAGAPDGAVAAKPPEKYYLTQEPAVQGALISLDPRSGYIQAMIGGYDFERSEFNRAFQACRQPGSAFKPIVYASAIEKLNWSPSTMIVDSPIVLDDAINENRWKPGNYEESFVGDVTLRDAIVNSYNLPAIKTLAAVGASQVAAYAHQLGIHTPLAEDMSIALGSSCVTLWELTNVYGTFNQLGRRPDSIFVTRVMDRDGSYLEAEMYAGDAWLSPAERLEAAIRGQMKERELLMEPQTAYIVTSLMRDVCRSGTGAAASALGKPVAGKTGTTNDAYDAWFMAFTPSLVTGVWVGYDTYEKPLGKFETGGKAALPIWMDYMKEALAGVKELDFAVPAGIVFRTVDQKTGLLARKDTVRAFTQAYKQGHEPTEATQALDKVEDEAFFKVDTGMP